MEYIGIDIGTSSICGIAYRPSDKSCKTIVKENSANMVSSCQWEKIQDPERIYYIVEQIIDELRTVCTDIKGIGFSGQMHGILYVDADGMAVSPLYTWQDGRGNLPYKEGETYVDYMTKVTGWHVATGYGLVTHYYNLHNGIVPDTAIKLCTIMDYVAMRLCKQANPSIELSNAASLGLFDKQRLAFKEPLLDRLHMDSSVLPTVVESRTVIGHYGDIPVCVSIGDNQAAFLGSVKDKDRSIHITIGTSSQISVYSDEYIEINGLDTRPFPGGGYLLVGASLCGGASFALLKDFFGRTLKLFTGAEVDDGYLFRQMTSMAYRADSAEGIKVETLFSDTRSDPNKRGKIEGISLNNFTPENLIVKFVDGVCSCLYDYFVLIPDSISKGKTELVGSGNGLKNNPLMQHTLEEIFGKELRLSDVKEEAAFGACCMAMGSMINA